MSVHMSQYNIHISYLQHIHQEQSYISRKTTLTDVATTKSAWLKELLVVGRQRKDFFFYYFNTEISEP